MFGFKLPKTYYKNLNLLVSTCYLSGLFIILLGLSQVAHASDLTENQSLSIQSCQTQLISQDIEQRYQKIQKQMEQDYRQGLPQKLKSDLVAIRKNIDLLSLQAFELDENNSQELNLIVQKTVDYLEQMISLLPQASALAPKVRVQYVVPFTNINSIKAEQQECQMKIAVADAKQNIEDINKESSANIYKNLTTELNQLNKNLYRLETTDVQKFVHIRAKLLEDFKKYNKGEGSVRLLTQQIPQLLNTTQAEIERVLPGLELSKEYYSIVD